MTRRLLAVCFAAALPVIAAGCASVSRVDAAADIHTLLVAIRDDDRATFDAHVDRAALSRQVEAHIVAQTREGAMTDPMKAMVMMLAPMASQAAADLALRPSAFRVAAAYLGYRPDMPIPGQMAIAGALKATAPGEVCATRTRNGPCLMTFAQQNGVWKLVRFDGALSDLGLR